MKKSIKLAIEKFPITEQELHEKGQSLEDTAELHDLATYPNESSIGKLCRRYANDPVLLRRLVLNDRASKYRDVVRDRLRLRLRGAE